MGICLNCIDICSNNIFILWKYTAIFNISTITWSSIRIDKVEGFCKQDFFWCLVGFNLLNTTVIQCIVMCRNNNTIFIRWNSIVVSGSRCELNHLLVAFDIFTDIGPCESIHFYSFLILIVTYRARCNKTLFFFSVPQNELFCFSAAITRKSSLSLCLFRVIRSSIKAICLIIINLNILL